MARSPGSCTKRDWPPLPAPLPAPSGLHRLLGLAQLLWGEGTAAAVQLGVTAILLMLLMVLLVVLLLLRLAE